MRLSKVVNPMDDDAPVVWTDVYRLEPTALQDRFVVAPAKDPLGLMCELAEAIGPEYFALYMHAVPRSDHDPGRYQSPAVPLVDLRIFIEEYAEMLENDGRHELWIGSAKDEGMLAYDDHGLIYAYGPLIAFDEVLTKRGLKVGEFEIPAPHAHCFHAEYDADVERLLSHWDWSRTDLRPEDER